MSTEHPFILPLVLELSKGSRPYQQLNDWEESEDPSQWSTDRVPPELVPFIESRSLATLEEVLKKSGALYWHPLVRDQIRYLERLAVDHNEWERLGWWHPPSSLTPHEAYEAWNLRRSLVLAHAAAMFPSKIVKLHPHHKRPGPFARINNPYPHNGSGQHPFVQADEIGRNWWVLKERFKQVVDQKPLPASPTATQKARIKNQMLTALERHCPSWTRLRRWRILNFAGQKNPIQRKPVPVCDLPDAENKIRDMCTNRRYANKEGKPALLAYATLAILLDVKLPTIRDLVTNHRRRHPHLYRKPPPPR